MEIQLPQRKDDLQSLFTNLSIVPISGLPPELLSLIISLSLPMMNPMHEKWQYRECWRYMAGVYKLRCVSAIWRDLIDTTPSFWTLISLSWPQEIVKTALTRSATSPIIIQHFPLELPAHADWSTRSREFLRLVHPHRSRWIAAILAIPMRHLSELFDAPTPRLHTLKLSLTGGSPRPLNPELLSLTPTFAQVLESLEHVHLTPRSYQFDMVLGAFTRLKSLALVNLGPRCAAIDQIIQMMQNNPSLETFLLIGPDATADSNVHENTTRAALPRLRVFRVESSIIFIHNLITRIELPLSIDQLNFIATATGSSWHLREANFPLWLDAMRSLSPIIQKLHRENDGSKIFLEHVGRCRWTTNGHSGGFKFQISRLNHPLTLEWIATFLKDQERASGLPNLSFASDSGFIEEASTLIWLNAIDTLETIEISIDDKNPHIDEFLGFLSGRIEGVEDESILFPSLRTLKIGGWESDMGEIIDAVRRRYSNKDQRPRHQLELDFTTSDAVQFEDTDIPKGIFTVGEVAEIRSLDGVRSVRVGCSGDQRGMLAVVWSEEKSQPVWV